MPESPVMSDEERIRLVFKLIEAKNSDLVAALRRVWAEADDDIRFMMFAMAVHATMKGGR